MDQDKWNALHEESHLMLGNVAIVEAAARLSLPDLETYGTLISLAWSMREKAVDTAGTLVPCNSCGATLTFPCTTSKGKVARHVHAARIRRASLKGLIPDMTVHVHANNREYKVADCVNA